MSPHQRQKLGDFGERLAVERLRHEGYKIVDTKWRCRYGEIDIIATQDDTLVFVEVRTRRSPQYVSPEESVNTTKQTKLKNLVAVYIQKFFPEVEPPPLRIDVIAIDLAANNVVTRIEHHLNAITDD